MPMIEHDTTFYSGTEEEYPAIPSIFKKRVCEKIYESGDWVTGLRVDCGYCEKEIVRYI